MPRPPTGLSTERLRELARRGAEHALNELRAEIIAVERTFPELKLQRGRQVVRKSIEKVTQRARTMFGGRPGRSVRRMKKYWAERRKAKAKMKP